MDVKAEEITRVSDCSHLTCSWAEEVPYMPRVNDRQRAKNRLFPIFLALVVLVGAVVFVCVVSIEILKHGGDDRPNNSTNDSNATSLEGVAEDESWNKLPHDQERLKQCRIVVLFAKTGVEAGSEAPYLDAWKEFQMSPQSKPLEQRCDIFEFDTRSDPDAVFDIVSNFPADERHATVFIGIGDYGLTQKTVGLLRNATVVVHSPQARVPNSVLVLPIGAEFQLKVDAILAKAAGMAAKKILPIVCDDDVQSRLFNTFSQSSKSGDLEVLPPVTALATPDTEIPDVKQAVILPFCAQELPAVLLWAKITSPRLMTRPWFTMDAVKFKDLQDNDVFARKVGPMVGLFTPLRQPTGDSNCLAGAEEHKTFGTFLKALTKLLPKVDPKELRHRIKSMLKDKGANKEEVALASMPLLNRKSGKAVLVRNQAWSIDSYLQFGASESGGYEFEGVRVPTLGQISRAALEAQLAHLLEKTCDTYWVTIQASDPVTCSATSDTFMMGGSDLKDAVGAPEQILFLVDAKFRGRLVCLKENKPAHKFRIDLKCNPTMEAVCKNLTLTVEGRGSRALELSETAVMARNQLARVGHFIQASSPCVGVGIFCALCLHAVGSTVTDMTMTACSAACLVTGTMACIGFVARESGAVLREIANQFP